MKKFLAITLFSTLVGLVAYKYEERRQEVLTAKRVFPGCFK